MKKEYMYEGVKPSHISASQISTAQCLYKYLRCRLIGDIKESTLPQALGSLIHSVIHQYTKYCVQTKNDCDYSEFETIFEKVFDEGKYPEEIYQEGREIAVKYCEQEVGIDKILDFERKETVKIDTDKNGFDINVELIIDRVNSYKADKGTVLEIIDHKNQMNILSKTEIDKHQQGNIYKYIAAKFLYPNFNWIKFGINFTRYNFIRWGEIKQIKDCTEEFDGTHKFLTRQWERLINSTEYPPQRCGACFDYGQCSVMRAGECPLWSKKELSSMLANNSIEDKVRAYWKLKEDLKYLQTLIKKHFETNKNLSLDGSVVGFETKVKTRYFIVPWFKYCIDHKININDITISKTDAEDAIGRHKKLNKMTDEEMKAISKMQDNEMSSKFSME